ncbi:hypothetical protein [Streptomyces sp. NPDC047972]|uniref:hypothetical protein n=1 Tax=Streptomyces sp. NPDC047972 TaxID=3365493 RepID=UPI0037225545
MKGAAEMRDGDEIRLVGSGGAPLLVTVGRPFSAEEIERRLKSGEWRREGDKPPAGETGTGPQPRTEKLSKASDEPGPGPSPRTEKLSKPEDEPGPGPQPRREFLSEPGHRPDQELAAEEAVSGDPERPADTANKSEWVAYIARTQHMSREDAANYTKADLISMAD